MDIWPLPVKNIAWVVGNPHGQFLLHTKQEFVSSFLRCKLRSIALPFHRGVVSPSDNACCMITSNRTYLSTSERQQMSERLHNKSWCDVCISIYPSGKGRTIEASLQCFLLLLQSVLVGKIFEYKYCFNTLVRFLLSPVLSLQIFWGGDEILHGIIKCSRWIKFYAAKIPRQAYMTEKKKKEREKWFFQLRMDPDI